MLAAALAVSVRIMISYANVDMAQAVEIEDRLRAAGCETWRDERLSDGGAWRAEVEQAIEWADVVLVLMSPAARKSANVADEVEYARSLEKRIVPVPLTDIKMPMVLIRLHWVKPKDVGRLCKGAK